MKFRASLLIVVIGLCGTLAAQNTSPIAPSPTAPNGEQKLTPEQLEKELINALGALHRANATIAMLEAEINRLKGITLQIDGARLAPMMIRNAGGDPTKDQWDWNTMAIVKKPPVK